MELQEKLEKVLIKLVDLKDYKSQWGKDTYYNINQKEAWDMARDLLKECKTKHLEDETRLSNKYR